MCLEQKLVRGGNPTVTAHAIQKRHIPLKNLSTTSNGTAANTHQKRPKTYNFGQTFDRFWIKITTWKLKHKSRTRIYDNEYNFD